MTTLFHQVVNIACYQFGSAETDAMRQLIENATKAVKYCQVEESVALARQFQDVVVFLPYFKHFLRMKRFEYKLKVQKK